MEGTITEEEEIETKIARFKQMKESGHEAEAFLLQAELQEMGVWVD